MQKKLKLVVMALFIASAAFAQNTKTTTNTSTSEDEEQSNLSEQAFTFTEAQLGEDDDMSQNVSIISSNQNVFASSAGYQFSSGRYRYRAFNQKYNEIYINGAPMNDMETGQFRFSLIGGLNRQTNSSRETTLPFEYNNFSVASMAGSNNYNFRPSNMATGQYASIAAANRNYTLRGMYNYNTGLMSNGWAFSAAVTYRWAKRGYVEGTFYNSLSYFFGAEKKLNDSHSISFITWGSPTERASQGASTDEAYWLANDRYYNPYWGYQAGEKRNSRIVKEFSPAVLFTWDWQISQKTKLSTSLTGRYTTYKGTSLNYNGGENPSPDYWKRMPSSNYNVWFPEDKLNTAQAYDSYFRSRTHWMGSDVARQIDWDALYFANRQGNATGRDAAYYVQAKNDRTLNLTLASILRAELSKKLNLTAGISLATNKGMHFKTMDDLLGATTFHGNNSYAISHYNAGDSRTQYDLNNPDALVREGDTFGYDYNLLVEKIQGWAALKYNEGFFETFIAGRMSGTTMQRDGKMRNGIAEYLGLSSYGKSDKAKFLDGGFKAGATFNLGAGFVIGAGIGYDLKTPQAKTAFTAPELSNDFVANLKNEKIFSSEANLQYSNTWMKANVNAYYSRLSDVTEWSNYFDDNIGAFSYVSMTNIKKSFYGLEWGLNFKINSAFSLKVLGNVSDAINLNNANVRYQNSTEGAVYEELVLNKNMRESGTPLSVYGAVASFHSGGWFIDLAGNYYDRIYLSYSPIFRYESSLRYRDKAAIARGIDAERVFDDEGRLIQSAVEQSKGKGGFMLDLNIGRTIRLKTGQLSINLMITNLLNNTSIVTGGYEQSRSDQSVNNGEVSTSRLYRFSKNPKKFYAWGINGMLNIGYRF